MSSWKCCNKWLFLPCCTGAEAEEFHAFGDSTIARVDIQFRECEDQKCDSEQVEPADIDDGNNVATNKDDVLIPEVNGNDGHNIPENGDIDKVSKVSTSTCSSTSRTSVKKESNDRQNIPDSEDIDEVSKGSSSLSSSQSMTSVKKESNDRQDILVNEDIDKVSKGSSNTCANKFSVKKESSNSHDIPENDDIDTVSKGSSSTCLSKKEHCSSSDASTSSLNEDSPTDVKRLSKASTMPMISSLDVRHRHRASKIPVVSVPLVSTVNSAREHGSRKSMPHTRSLPRKAKSRIPVSLQLNNDLSERTRQGIISLVGVCRVPVSIKSKTSSGFTRQSIAKQSKSSIPIYRNKLEF